MDTFSLRMQGLTLFIGWMLAILVGLFALRILYLIYRGKIDMTCLLCESTSDKQPTAMASMARFQFLIFTFVIALSLFLVIVACAGKGGVCASFPDIPASILGLLGISGASYAVGKGIQASSNSKPGTPSQGAGPNPPTAGPVNPAAAAPVAPNQNPTV